MHSFETLVSRIVSATNWQNAIKPSDLMSNDRRQIEVERQFRKLDYLYIRKRMTKGEARPIARSRSLRLVKKEEIAQAVAGCDLDPAVLRLGRNVFSRSGGTAGSFLLGDPKYYLSRYWLMQILRYAARGYPERAYARWLVLSFMWSRVEPLCRSRVGSDAFRRSCERDVSDVITPLLRASDEAFKSALLFFRSKEARDAAQDVSSFSGAETSSGIRCFLERSQESFPTKV